MAAFRERAAHSDDHILTICNLGTSIFRFGFEGWIWDLITAVPGLSILFTFTDENLVFGTVQSGPSSFL